MALSKPRENDRNTRWICRCECGTVKDVLGYILKNGDSKSCGCYAKEFQRNRLLREMKENPDKYGLKTQTGAASFVVEKDGQKKTLTEWSKEINVSLSVLIRRWNRGWTPEQILEPTIEQIKESYRWVDPQFDPKELPPQAGGYE